MIHKHDSFALAMTAAIMCSSHGTAQPVTTIVTHGYSLDGSKGAWLQGMAQAIVDRAGAGAVCRYDQATGAWQLVSGTLDADQPVGLIFRWLQDFDKPGNEWGYGEGAADALYAALRDPTFIDGGGQPLAPIDLVDGRDMHFLGHSRGVIVNSEVVERFAVAGITVDHVTGFDPHPMDGTLDWPVNYEWGDPAPQRWNNIVFHDNYWRADGGIFNAVDPDGIPIPGALNVELNESALNCCAYSNAHSDVHLWYHGTIDLADFPCDGEQCINQQMRDTWWPSGYTNVGFYYAQIGGGVAARPAQGPGVAPGVVPDVYGGTFDQASHAGWRFHGGALNAAIVNESGRTFLKLGPAQGTSATHNRFFLPLGASAVSMSYRILTSDTTGFDDAVRVSLIDAAGAATELVGTIDATQPDSNWVAGAMMTIPASVVRGKTYRMQVVLDGGPTLHATVGVDDIGLEFAGPCPADLVSSGTFQPPPDGVVDGADLGFLLGEWGPNRNSLADIVTNITFEPPPDGVVDGADLAVLLAAWGVCE